MARQSQPDNDESTGPLRHLQSKWYDVPNKVLIEYGLEKMAVNSNKVFNLFCIYGKVTSVKVLNGKQVLVELQDVESAMRCPSNLNLLRLDKTTRLKDQWVTQLYTGISICLVKGSLWRKVRLRITWTCCKNCNYSESSKKKKKMFCKYTFK